MSSDSASRLESAAPVSTDRRRPANGFALRYRNAEIPVLKPELVVGRTADADIVIESTLVSRRHAALRLEDGELSVEDLGSRNGTYVNGRATEGRTPLGVGDKVLVGDHELAIIEVEHAPRSRQVATAQRTREQKPMSAGRDGAFAAEERTHYSSALGLLGGLVDKAFVMGHGAEAERLLSSHLINLLGHARSGKRPAPETAATAARYALKLAGALGRPAWVDYAVDLYAAMNAPLPMALVDELFTLLRRLRGVDVPKLRAYLAALRENAARLGPADRFALQRLEGLLKIAG